MGIWIRSQDGKKFINANELWRDTKSVYGCHNTTDDAGIILGTYADNSEATRVMDMIQECIAKGRGQMEDFGDGITIVSDVVFQMPKAGFSEEG